MKDKLEVFSIGTEVQLAEDVFGTIIGINIYGSNYTTYEIGWWNGRSYDSKHFSQQQITPVLSTKKTQIGFTS